VTEHNPDDTLTLVRDGLVRVERIGHVARLTLNRPDSRNAVDVALSTALGEALAVADADPAIRAIVVQGAGPAFCAGQDLRALEAGEGLRVPDHPEWGYGGIVEHRLATPTIAAVHGYAFGGGLEIALSCDLIVLGASARVGLPEVTLGMFAAAAGVPRIAQQIPPKIAARMVLTGLPLEAHEAAQFGLASEVVPDDDVHSRALELAHTIAGNAPLAVQASKRILRDLALSDTWDSSSWEQIDREFEPVRTSADAAEGLRAFVDKRAPEWNGR
jgi:crotonobetainyl-CoA hydratase